MAEESDDGTDKRNPWEGDEVPWRLEDEGGDKETAPKDGDEERRRTPEPGEVAETGSGRRVPKGTWLKFGVVVVLAVLIAGAYLGVTVVADDGPTRLDDEEREQAHEVDESDANENGVVALPFEAGSTGGDQRLELRNFGDEIRTERITVEVTLVDSGNSASVTSLPTDRLGNDETAGDDIFDRSYGGVGGAATEETWKGDDVVLRVKHSDDGARLDPGDKVRVVVEHETRGTVFSETLKAV